MYSALKARLFGDTGKTHEDESPKTKPPYPVEELTKLVGQELELCRVEQGVPRPPLMGAVQFEPHLDGFYFGNSRSSYFLVKWYDKDGKGLDAVKSIIVVATGEVVYNNPNVPYDHELAAVVEAKRQEEQAGRKVQKRMQPKRPGSVDGLVLAIGQ